MTDELIVAVMERFGVGPQDFVRAQACPEMLALFQRQMKLRYRALVTELHPDKGGNEDMFKAVTAVYQDIEAMRLREESVYRTSSSRRSVKWAVTIQMETAS